MNNQPMDLKQLSNDQLQMFAGNIAFNIRIQQSQLDLVVQELLVRQRAAQTLKEVKIPQDVKERLESINKQP